jgi:kinesin family protein 5
MPPEVQVQNVVVCCRIRPQNQHEIDEGGTDIVTSEGTRVYVAGREHFEFDRVFPPQTTQAAVFATAKPLIDSVLDGYNGTVFAYGQTGGGKTYTMEGTGKWEGNSQAQGIIPRTVYSIFEGIYSAPQHIEFVVKCSLVEIYNERIRDLLNLEKDNLLIREDRVRGVFIADVTEVYVDSEKMIFEALDRGAKNRAVGATNMNEHSSRSHMVFILSIEQKNAHTRTVKVGTLNLVDLAGSEKVAKTGSSGTRLDEAKNINRSLSALGNVINALTERKRGDHVPYRDSKLTRVLQEALGGNSKTCLLLSVSPSSFNSAETVSTLRFGARAKLIKTYAKVNQERSAEELKLQLSRLQTVAESLKNRIATLETVFRSRGISAPAATETVVSPEVSLEDIVPELDQLQEELAETVGERDADREELLLLQEEKKEPAEDPLTSEVTELQNERARLSARRTALAAELAEYTEAAAAEPTPEEQSQMSKMESNLTELRSQFGESNDSKHEQLLDRVDAALGRTRSARSDERKEDRPLKRKVSQLDKNLEQLTVMYHKLVSQNSQLKTDNAVNEKRLSRKEQRVTQLEKNLREAKAKYEKLLNQCANLTSAMDLYHASVQGHASRLQPRGSAQIRVPLKGGVKPAQERVEISQDAFRLPTRSRAAKVVDAPPPQEDTS